MHREKTLSFRYSNDVQVESINNKFVLFFCIFVCALRVMYAEKGSDVYELMYRVYKQQSWDILTEKFQYNYREIILVESLKGLQGFSCLSLFVCWLHLFFPIVIFLAIYNNHVI